MSETVTPGEMREILRTFADSAWTGMTLRLDGLTIAVGKHGAPAAEPAKAVPPPVRAAAAEPAKAAPAATEAEAASPAPPVTGEADTTGCFEVRSPAVGSFWVAPSPGEAPFVHIGQTVEAGDQLAIVEVMKLMNPVVTPRAGEIVRIAADNAALVEYDQVLFLIRPHDD